MPRLTVVTTWLELVSPADFKAPGALPPTLTVAAVSVPSPELNRFFYTAVGGDWSWTDRLPWTYDDWMMWLTQPGVRTLVISVDGAPVGYAELERTPEGDTEIAYFGLLPQWTGRGLGSSALALVVRDAWEGGATRIWLHTCTLDHPNALENYRARGFRVVRTAEAEKEVPATTPGPWPGAR